VINSQGSLVNQLEQAKVTGEQAKQAAVDTRRKLFDEIMYERAHTPSFTENQERIQALQLRRAQNTAAITEIWSAKALNDLLKDAIALAGKGTYPEHDYELDPDTLKQINVTGTGNGNIGILRNEGRLSWPLGLRSLKKLTEKGDDPKELRETLHSKALAAVQQAANGKVGAGVLKDLQENLAKLQKILAGNIRDLPTDQYIEAKRYLNSFEDALKALREENVGTYFNLDLANKVKNVKELVQFMAKKGLRFAPATSGDEGAYQALHNSLAAYDLAARREAAASAKE
jgi:hypothetical protein